jgi:hypothetical protein
VDAARFPTRFATQYELATLPYFELREGRLVQAAPGYGPAIDMHCHLALAYVRAMRVDLGRLHPRTEHYLPLERAIDLDLYANKNFSRADLGRMRHDLVLHALSSTGMRATHTVPNLLREMGELGIAASVLLPIDQPILSDNAGAYLTATAGEERLVCFGSVHPWARGVAGKLDAQKARGIRGVKVHPAVQSIRPDHPRGIQLYRRCGERGLPVLWHCGPVGIEPAAQRRRCHLRFYEPPLARCPETTFLLGHSGALQMGQALRLAQRYENAWLELSSQGLPAVRRIVAEAPRERIVYGSDWPFYHQAMALAKVLIATEGDEALRRLVLYGNAARLLGLEGAQARAGTRGGESVPALEETKP